MSFSQKFQIRKSDRKRYVFAERRDYEILSKIYQLEKIRLDKHDKNLVKFMKTQLKRDWRKPVVQTLNKLLKKYELK